MDVALAKELYYREFEGKAQQDARLSVYVALLSALGGLVAFLLRSSWPGATRLCLSALVLASIAAALLLLAVAGVFRATVGFDYEKLPHANVLLDYFAQLTEYFQNPACPPGDAASQFNAFLLRHLASAATRNAHNNLIRASRFHRAGQLLIGVLACAAVSAALLAAEQALPILAKKGA